MSEYYKQDVYDTHDNKIGDVSDVLLDKNGQVTAVILGVGFLGMGEKDVAVPFNSVRLTEEGRQAVSGDGYHKGGSAKCDRLHL